MEESCGIIEIKLFINSEIIERGELFKSFLIFCFVIFFFSFSVLVIECFIVRES